MQRFKNVMASLAAGFSSVVMLAAPVAAASSTVVVTPSDTQGWVFNADPNNATPYQFNEDQASTGEGSLYVEPLSTEAARKFIATLPLGTAAADLGSISYDFLIAGNGDTDDADQFYLNVYTNTAGSSTFYDCRFDYVPTASGSTTEFTTATFSVTDTPTRVGDRADAFDCPDTLAEMPEGSTISAFTLNVGDTSANDAGLAGYLDNVVVTQGTDSTAYDFELADYVDNKDECKDGGWEAGLADGTTFKNQGDCVSHFASEGKAKGNPIVNFFTSLFRR